MQIYMFAFLGKCLIQNCWVRVRIPFILLESTKEYSKAIVPFFTCTSNIDCSIPSDPGTVSLRLAILVCEKIFYFVFICSYLMNKDVLIGHFYILPKKKNSLLKFLPIYIEFCLSYLQEFFINAQYESLVRFKYSNYIFSERGLTFHFFKL